MYKISRGIFQDNLIIIFIYMEGREKISISDNETSYGDYERL